MFAAATLFAGIRHAPFTLAAFAASALTGLAAFGARFATGFTRAALARLVTRLARILFSTTLAGLPGFARLAGLAVLSRLSTARSLGDFALELFGERIEFRLGETKLLRLVTQHALGRAFDAAAQFFDPLFRLLAGLASLRKITFPQEVAGEVEGFSATFALSGAFQPIIKIARQHATRQQVGARLLYRVRIILADLADAVVKLAGQ